jgi:endogenous inhibitor of DNA gyrase (YacG/DUF329 family)
MADGMCVLCRKQPVDPEWKPFCSRRCQLLDLARWVDGSYAVPGEKTQLPESEKPKDRGSQ